MNRETLQKKYQQATDAQIQQVNELRAVHFCLIDCLEDGGEIFV